MYMYCKKCLKFIDFDKNDTHNHITYIVSEMQRKYKIVYINYILRR